MANPWKLGAAGQEWFNKADKIAAELRAMGHQVERTDRDIS